MTNLYILRSTFNSAAREYDAIRPGYPNSLIEDVITLSEMPEGGHALEIGCGTGQATLPFARRGYHILCLDIGPDLLAVAKENLKAYPGVTFRRTSFENWPARVGKYDLVFSATAFHWIPREVGYSKSALVLKPGGALAVFANRFPGPYSGFFAEVQSVYRKCIPEWWDPTARPPITDEIQSQADYINATGLFAPVIVRTYPWSQTYTTQEYLRLLNTYSDHLNLEETRRQALYEGIAEMIDQQYGGKIERPYLSILYLARKK